MLKHNCYSFHPNKLTFIIALLDSIWDFACTDIFLTSSLFQSLLNTEQCFSRYIVLYKQSFLVSLQYQKRNVQQYYNSKRFFIQELYSSPEIEIHMCNKFQWIQQNNHIHVHHLKCWRKCVFAIYFKIFGRNFQCF